MALTGDFAALRELGNRLSRFEFDPFAKAIGEESEKQYVADFSAQRDPWGDAWTNKSGKTPVNDLTGALANPVLGVTGKTIKLKLESYWVFQQVGANNASQRAVVPFGSMDATVWAAPMKAAADEQVARAFGQKP